MLYMFRAVSPHIIRSSRTVHTASGMCQACSLLPLGSSEQAWHIPDAVCTVLEVLMMGGETPSSEQAWHIPDAVCTVLEVLMMGRETTRNM